MAALFRRGEYTSEMNPAVAKWGRIALVILGILVIVGLVAGTFAYGNRRRQAVENGGQPATEQPQEQPSQSQPQPAPPQAPEATNNQPTAPESAQTPSSPAPAESTPQSSSGSNLPETVPNTGPEDWAPFVGSAIVLLGWYYRRSQRKLLDAQIEN